MAIVHKNLPDDELHEPKGIASAEEGMIYRANGAGGGEWTFSPLGWGYYQDAAAEQTFNTTAAKLSIDGLGALTNENYLPREIRGSDSLWNSTDDKIEPIRLGDSYDFRLELPVTTKTGSPTELTITFDIGAAGTIKIPILNRYVSLAKTPPYTISVGFPIVALSATTVANGIQIFLTTDSGSVGVTAPSVTLVKNVDGDW